MKSKRPELLPCIFKTHYYIYEEYVNTIHHPFLDSYANNIVFHFLSLKKTKK